MKKLLSIILAGLMLIGCFGVTAFADEEQAKLSVTASDCKITLSWEDSGEESYSVYWKRSSSETWKLAGTTSKHKVNITGLTNGVSYDFKVEIGGEFTETVTEMPMGNVYALLEYFGDDEYSAYAISDLSSVSAIKTVYEALSGSDDEIAAGSSYYKITFKDGGKLVEVFISEDDDSYQTVREVADSLTPGVTVEMPYTAEDFEYINADYSEEDYNSWNFVEDYTDVNSLLAMYYVLDYITEPTDAELVKDNHTESIMTVSFEAGGENHWFSVDENNTITWDTADGNYKFKDENVGYKSAVHHYVFDVANSTFYKGMKEIE